ncbi:putative transposase, Ptta/En/Spm, plant [Helianthus annuus]|nr:putative transposase, Ptta/En/Spm, plant [Helianthus annuus]
MKWLTCWTWDPSNEQAIYEGFVNMKKKRFREIMMQLRIKAIKLAYKACENVDLRNSNQFRIFRKYQPESIPINIWCDMCSAWNTKAWLSQSKCGSSNRNSADINGRSSRHTGGSTGFDEQCENWRRTYGREPTWKELFLQTHLTKECKEKLRKCEISIYDMKNLKFCTNRSKEVYVSYPFLFSYNFLINI